MIRRLLARAIFWVIEPELKRREREALSLVVKAMSDLPAPVGSQRRFTGAGGSTRY